MLTSKHFAMIHAAKRQLDLTEDDYRGLLLRIGGAESARDLSADGFTRLIGAFEVLGFRRTKAPSHVRRGMATPAQIALVESMWKDWSGSDNGEGLRQWLERSYRISAPRFMTGDHAAMAINGLRQMLRRKEFHTRQAAHAGKPAGAS
ncbi:MAG: regulatory protein GemA [Bosea sp.]|nr:regulatory protein GemA [Bosea sp. (in: a-proteobacteria)]